MSTRLSLTVLLLTTVSGVSACAPSADTQRPVFEPREIVDLGTVVTEDLPERLWGKALLAQFAPLGFTRQHTFEVVEWELGEGENQISGSNAYYEFFNHGGPHVDAPNHVSLGGGLDSYPIDVFLGPVRVFDVRDRPFGHSIPAEVFQGHVNPGDVVLIHTGYAPPATDDAVPELSTLTPDAAEYLANLPVRAFGTDAFSVDPMSAPPFEGESATARAVPVHHAFLSRAIPVYEQLFNLDSLLGKADSDLMYFVGVPLSILDGDGILVRPVVFVY